MSDAQVQERLAYIQQALDDGETYAKLWQWGWVSVFGTSAAFGAGMMAAKWHTKVTRASMMALAGKSTLATTMLLLMPLEAGSAPGRLRALPAQTSEERKAALAEAERLLAASAEDARRKTTWLMHAINLLVNVTAGAVTYAYLRSLPKGSDAYASRYKTPLTGFALGFASTELKIFMTPTRTRDAWQEYQRRYEQRFADSGSTATWFAAPVADGIMVGASF